METTYTPSDMQQRGVCLAKQLANDCNDQLVLLAQCTVASVRQASCLFAPESNVGQKFRSNTRECLFFHYKPVTQTMRTRSRIWLPLAYTSNRLCTKSCISRHPVGALSQRDCSRVRDTLRSHTCESPTHGSNLACTEQPIVAMGVLGQTNRSGSRGSPHSSLRTSSTGSPTGTATNNVFGYKAPELPPALHRDVFKFLQSLDMTHPIKDPRRDLCNGFLVAEMFSRIYPADVQMHAYNNGTSSSSKRDNWQQIRRLCRKHDLPLPDDMVEATMAGQHGAAINLLEYLYEVLTKKKLQRMPPMDHMGGMDTQTPVPVSFGEPTADNGTLKAIRAAGAAAGPGVSFGPVQTAMVGEAAELRKRFAAGRS